MATRQFRAPDPGKQSEQVAALAESWAQRTNRTLVFRADYTLTFLALLDAQERSMLACACELYDLVVSTPEGRKAFADLGLEPLDQDRKGPGG
jgi:hypothetical protein